MAPSLGSRKNIITTHTHTHLKQMFLHRGHQMAPTLARRKNIETKETQAKDAYTLRLSQASPTTYDKGRTPLCE